MNNKVHLLWYVQKLDEDEEELLIGVYSSDSEAKSAIERLKDKPGFVGFPHGFQINEYELDRDHWTEGFIVG